MRGEMDPCLAAGPGWTEDAWTAVTLCTARTCLECPIGRWRLRKRMKEEVKLELWIGA